MGELYVCEFSSVKLLFFFKVIDYFVTFSMAKNKTNSLKFFHILVFGSLYKTEIFFLRFYF